MLQLGWLLNISCFVYSVSLVPIPTLITLIGIVSKEISSSLSTAVLSFGFFSAQN